MKNIIKLKNVQIINKGKLKIIKLQMIFCIILNYYYKIKYLIHFVSFILDEFSKTFTKEKI